MKEQDYEQLTLFPEDSPVSRSASQAATDKDRQMTVISGLKCSESYENSNPLGCLVKTCLASSIWHSTRCSLTWKTAATPHRRLLFRLAVLTRHTNVNGSLFWPTPSVGAALCGGTGNFKMLKRMAEKGLISEEERRQFSQGNGGKTNPGLLEWLMGYEQAFTQLVPTPTARDWKGAPASRFIGGGSVPAPSPRIAGMHPAWEDWPCEPGIRRVVDGVPHRVDRIKCLGNAVVPQQFYIFFQLMADQMKGILTDDRI